MIKIPVQFFENVCSSLVDADGNTVLALDDSVTLEDAAKLDIIAVFEDAARWRFVIKAAAEPASAEGLAFAACHKTLRPDTPEDVQITAIVDEGRALLASAK